MESKEFVPAFLVRPVGEQFCVIGPTGEAASQYYDDPESANWEASRLTQLARHLEAAESALSVGSYSSLRFNVYSILRLIGNREDALAALTSLGAHPSRRVFGPLV